MIQSPRVDGKYPFPPSQSRTERRSSALDSTLFSAALTLISPQTGLYPRPVPPRPLTAAHVCPGQGGPRPPRAPRATAPRRPDAVAHDTGKRPGHPLRGQASRTAGRGGPRSARGLAASSVLASPPGDAGSEATPAQPAAQGRGGRRTVPPVSPPAPRSGASSRQSGPEPLTAGRDPAPGGRPRPWPPGAGPPLTHPGLGRSARLTTSAQPQGYGARAGPSRALRARAPTCPGRPRYGAPASPGGGVLTASPGRPSRRPPALTGPLPPGP